MPLEAGTLIPDMDANNPLGSDPKSEGDDHLRLVKRCVQGTFPAFIGTTATPKTVTLTEDEINDAALKLAANTFAATNTFNALSSFNSAPRLANDISLNGRIAALTDTRNLIKLDTSDQVEIGDRDANQVNFFSTSISVQDPVGAVFSFQSRATGGASVRSRRATFLEVGFRSPETIGNPSTIIQDYEGLLLRFTGVTARVLTVDAMLDGTNMILVNQASNRQELVAGTASLAFLTPGGGGGFSSLFLESNAVAQIMWAAGGGSALVWGSGISKT